MTTPEITPERLAELDALAEKATPGPWHAGRVFANSVDAGNAKVGRDTSSKIICTPAQVGGFDSPIDNAAYIAAASPDVVRALVAELRVREKQAEILGLLATDDNDTCNPRRCLDFHGDDDLCDEGATCDYAKKVEAWARREACAALNMPLNEVVRD